MQARYYISLFILVAITACKKEDRIKLSNGSPSLTVTTSGTTFKVKQDVVFTLSGKSEIISFYSGEPYRQYDYREGRTVEVSAPKMAFTSAVTGGAQANQLMVLASTDFNGVYNDTLKAPLTDVHAATWTDITSRFTLGTTANFTASTTKDISDLVVAGKPLYIAFKYTTTSQAVSAGRTWMIQGFTTTANSSIGAITLNDQPNAGFRIVNDNPATAPSRSTIAASRVTLLSNLYAADNDPTTENWAITKAMDMGSFNSGPDRPIGLKALASPTLESYTYKFNTAGTYKVYFIGANADVDETRRVVVGPIELTIEP